MYRAADFGERRCIELLLDYQASIELSNVIDDTPLMNAARSGHKNVVELLLDRNASVEHQDKFGLYCADARSFPR